jgi:hypothetical protein
MDNNLHHLIQVHDAFYEVMPYYVTLEQGHGTPAAKTQRIQAGFDVDVYGIKTSEEPSLPERSPDYALIHESFLELAKTVSSHSTEGCTVDVIPFGSTVILDTKKNLQEEATLRIRITHCRGLDQPAGPPEQRTLEEVEKELRRFGVGKR